MRGEEDLKSAQRRPKRQRRRMSEDENINFQPVDTNVLAELEEIEVEFWMYKYKRYDNSLKNVKISKSLNFSFYRFFLTCVSNVIQIIFKYELQFVAFTWPNLLLVGRNFVSGISKLCEE